MTALSHPIHGKAQSVRLMDVFVLGPFMVWAGSTLAKDRPVAGGVLAVSGALTVLYNGRNYLLHGSGR